MIDTSKYWKVFASCVPVKGVVRSTICDLQRSKITYIPNDLYDILVTYAETIDETIERYGELNRPTILEYFQMLLDEEIIFLCNKDELERFPPIETSYMHPSIITNAVLEYSVQASKVSLQDVVEQLSDLGCEIIELRLPDCRSLEILIEVLHKFQGSRIESIHIYLPYADCYMDETGLHDIITNYERVLHVLVYSAPIEEIKPINDYVNVVYTRQNVIEKGHCGFVHEKYFTLNVQFYVETKNYNNCLNRKIYIGANGDIKNCPEAPKIHGNINDTSINNIVKNDEFKELWSVTKDAVEVCKVCEFRYVCSDCRIFTIGSKPHSKPEKCGYDPFTGQWN